MLKVLTFLLLTAYVSAHGYEDLIQKYGEKKIYESCFGTELYHQKMEEYHRWIHECQKEVGIDKKSGGSTSQDALSFFRLLGQEASAGQILVIPIPSQALTQLDNEAPSRFRRNAPQGRHDVSDSDLPPFFTKEKIQKLKDTKKKHVKMAKCVLKKAKILNQYSEIQWNEIEKHYQSLTVDAELKKDLLEGFSKCRNFAMCMGPDERVMDDPEAKKNYYGLKQAITYFKCERYKKVAACCKKDLRKKPEMFELGGLDGFMSNYDDDEKMHKILVMHSKFGSDFHRIFE